MDRRLTAYVLKYLLEHRFESKAEMARHLGMRQRTIEKVFANLDVAKAGKKIYNRNRKPHTWIIITGMGLASFLDLPRDL